jgi:hypothetical protein
MASLSKPRPTVVTGPVVGQAELPVTPESPSLSAALSRFEFEKDRGNEGTKILMVEWDTSKEGSKQDMSDWRVSWEGKSHVFPIKDSETDNKRVFFLLPPGAAIPSTVTIAQRSGGTVLRTKPLPAIFPATLGTDGLQEGKRGVLHSLWATKRLSELEREIETEMKMNGESIGLQMAIQERDWIADHFGVGEPSTAYPSSPLNPVAPPASPRSPVAGRLGEKLKGLKLATSPAELAAAATQGREPLTSHREETIGPANKTEQQA